MKDLKGKIKHWVKIILEFCLNPRLLLCFGIAWIITNGWSYVALGLSFWFKLKWLGIVATAYLTALWIPFTPEKIITVIIAIFLLRIFFPNDKKTLERLRNIKESIKKATKNHFAERKRKKELAKKERNVRKLVMRKRNKKRKRKSHKSRVSRKRNK